MVLLLKDSIYSIRDSLSKCPVLSKDVKGSEEMPKTDI